MRFLWILLASIAVIAPGMAHGIWTCRWDLSDEPQASAARLASLPLSIFNWEGEDLPVDAQQVSRVDLAGLLVRRYDHRDKKGHTSPHVLVMVACGRPGPTSVHSPEICYPGQGYRQMAERQRKSIHCSTGDAEFFMAPFEKKNQGGEAERIQIYWSWKGTGGWVAPSQPRFVFGAQPVLHKLYVVQPLSGPHEVSAKACEEFIQNLIPDVQNGLFSQ